VHNRVSSPRNRRNSVCAQHAFDSVVVWGFRKMRSSGEVQTRKSHRLMRIARGTLGILGRTGDAYYRKYEELKRAKR
jgi:hypothetical protein